MSNGENALMNERTAAQVLEAMVAMFDSGDSTDAADVVAEGYLDHQGLGQGPMVGIAGFVDVVEGCRAGFEQMTVTVEDLFGSGGKVRRPPRPRTF